MQLWEWEGGVVHMHKRSIITGTDLLFGSEREESERSRKEVSGMIVRS